MAVRYTTKNARQGRTEADRKFFVYGSTVRQVEALPEDVPETYPQREKKRASRQVRRNRNRAMSIGPVYARFLAAAAVCAVLLCMMYLRLQSEVASRSENITALQEQLAELTEENNAAYNAAVDSVNLETVFDKAINEMGMVYASEGNVVEYNSPTSDYVKQYNDIPKNGVLAKSSDVSE